MKQLFNPTFFDKTFVPLKKALAFLALTGFGFGLYFALFASPADYQQGEFVRIMYIHVPCAWLSLMIYGAMSLFALMGLWLRLPMAFIFLRAATPIGLLLSALTLITGMLWGKPMWGAFWVWDGRLTSVLILFITYVAIETLLKSFDDTEKGERITGFFTLFGALNLPIIKWSVVWWNTLHQPPSLKASSMPSIDVSMLTPLIIMTLALTALCLLLGIVRTETLLLKRAIAKHQKEAAQ